MKASGIPRSHIIACAAYIIALPVLQAALAGIGVFNFILDTIDLSEYSVLDFWVLSQRLPNGLRTDQKAFLNICHVGAPACGMRTFAIEFTGLAIVAAWVVPKLFDGPTFAAPVHPRTSKPVHFAACLALVVIGDRYVVWPVYDLLFDTSSTGLSYDENWRYLPGSTFAWHLSYFVAACLATRHSIRIRGWHDPSEFFDPVLAGTAKVRAHPGAPPLHVAARAAEPDAVITLLEHAANPHLRDRDGATALHIAATAGNVGAIEALIDAGANPNGIDGDGRTAVDRAELHDHPEASSALRARGGEPSKMLKGANWSDRWV